VADARTILLADDEAAFTKVVEMLLSVDGHEVVTVADGRDALAWLKEHTPDLAILDVAMPHLSGIEVCSRMKRVRRLRDVPVIILTALRNDVTRETARQAEADALVLKPLEGKDFRGLVRRLLAGERQPI
jgi:CheY-like chemotaxis protein